MTIKVIGTVNGGPITGALRRMPVAAGNATAIFRNDPVRLADDGTVVPTAAGEAVYGYCMGPEINAAVAATVHPGYMPASTAGFVLVIPANLALISIQEDTIGGYMVATNVGSTGDLVATAGSTVTGLSGYTLDSSDVIAKDAAPGSAQLLVVALDLTVGNEVGGVGISGTTRWVCITNESQLTFPQSGL